MQLRLLRFLQEKTFNPVGQDHLVQVDVRIIAATNVDLRQKVKAGIFREDLYYRLKVVEIHLPPLRERKECIPLLVHHFLAKFRDKLEKKIINISDQAMDILKSYQWPGNVRELRHVIERACVLCNGKTLLQEHFPDEILPGGSLTENRGQAGKTFPKMPGTLSGIPQYESFKSEEAQIIEALKATGGNKSKAAKLLGVDRSTLYRKMKRYELEPR
jgi:DNA-binding NtrC family response regulator